MKRFTWKATPERLLPALAGAAGSAFVFALSQGAVSILAGALVTFLSAVGYLMPAEDPDE